nr:copia protein [Tanacetum cinerariifolium]
MSAKDSIAIQTSERSEEVFNDFLALYHIPPAYHVILPKSNQIVFNAPPRYVRLLNPFVCTTLTTFVVMCKAYDCDPTVKLFREFFNLCRGEMAFRNFIYVEDEEDLSFMPKEPSTGFGTSSASVSVNTEPLRADDEHVLQPAEVTENSGGSPNPELFVVHPGSVAARMKNRKCKTGGGLSKPPMNIKLAFGSSTSRATRAKTSTSKDEALFLTVSDDDEGKGHVGFGANAHGEVGARCRYCSDELQVYGSTPMDIKDKLDLDQIGTPVDATKYHSMIGALMYITSSRPYIVHATYICARYQAHLTEKHLKDVKRIFRYLRGTVNTGLWCTKDFGFELTGFSYADYAGCKDTFKRTSGGAQFLGEKLVNWSLQKQDCTSLSIAESEYVSLYACCAQVLWMRTQFTDYGYHFDKIPIYCDSKSAIAISCNLVQHSRTKHIAVQYHFIKEHVEKGTIELYFVKTDYQLADIFTKALPMDRFNYLVRRLRMHILCPQELDRLARL